MPEERIHVEPGPEEGAGVGSRADAADDAALARNHGTSAHGGASKDGGTSTHGGDRKHVDDGRGPDEKHGGGADMGRFGVTGVVDALGTDEERVGGKPGVDSPTRSDVDAIHSTIADIEQVVLGAPRLYTAGQVADLVGLPLDKARQLWRGLGFADFGPARAFTDADVTALRNLRELVHSGRLPEVVATQFVRSVGATMARFAEWQTEAWMDYIGTGLTGDRSEQILAAVGDVMVELEPIVIYAWRRHLAFSGSRAMQGLADPQTVGQSLAVGFADLVGFTRLSRNLEEAELGHLVQTFEDTAIDVIAEQGGRLVKTLGDEVLFVTFSPDSAAELGIRLVEAMAAQPVLPELRVGIGYGHVLSRMGDVFGPTVNLASRLTALAPKDTVVVDRDLAAALEGDDRYELRAMWRRPVRGLGLVEPWTVTRGGSAEPVSSS